MNFRTSDFSKLGLGMFVHYGIYSTLGEGEWVKLAKNYSDEVYDKLALKFNPKQNFTDDICSFAKNNGFNYIVLTTRHHDGFSLYDTKGLNDFDSMHYIGRDILAEFVESCKKYDLIPILYHTLIDWREEKKYSSFSDYLKYLRESVKLLCTNYGKIGGIWFDGQWKYPNADWEEEALYSIIRDFQPEAVIVNNAGLSRLGERFSHYIDVVTYERSNISNYDYTTTIDKYAAEMCQALNGHWGYAENDIDYKSVKEILYNFCICRKNGGNYLLNIGPIGNGEIRSIEREIISMFSKWVKVNKEAMYGAEPFKMINLPDKVFSLKKGNSIYLVIMGIPMEIDENAGIYDKNPISIDLTGFEWKRITWLDSKQEVDMDGKVLNVKPYEYGTSMLVRVAKIEL